MNLYFLLKCDVCIYIFYSEYLQFCFRLLHIIIYRRGKQQHSLFIVVSTIFFFHLSKGLDTFMKNYLIIVYYILTLFEILCLNSEIQLILYVHTRTRYNVCTTRRNVR